MFSLLWAAIICMKSSLLGIPLLVLEHDSLLCNRLTLSHSQYLIIVTTSAISFSRSGSQLLLILWSFTDAI